MNEWTVGDWRGLEVRVRTPQKIQFWANFGHHCWHSEGKSCLAAKPQTWFLCWIFLILVFWHFLSFFPLEMDCDTPVHSKSAILGDNWALVEIKIWLLLHAMRIKDEDDILIRRTKRNHQNSCAIFWGFKLRCIWAESDIVWLLNNIGSNRVYTSSPEKIW